MNGLIDQMNQNDKQGVKLVARGCLILACFIFPPFGFLVLLYVTLGRQAVRDSRATRNWLERHGTTTVTFGKVATAPASARPPVYQRPPAYQVLAPVETRVCPGCEKEVKATARFCRYCRYEFEEGVDSDVPMERSSMTGAGSTTTNGGPEGPGEVHSTATRATARPLWEQPSFLVTLGVCAVWLSGLTSSSAKLQADRGAMIVLLILTVLGYAGYRKRRGWKALPTSGWLPSRQISRRRAIGTGAYLAVFVLGVAASALPQTTASSSVGPPGAADAPWNKSMAATTCGDWQSVMTANQRLAFAQSLLAYDLTKPHGPALSAATANDYIAMIADTCSNESPSSLVVQ